MEILEGGIPVLALAARLEANKASLCHLNSSATSASGAPKCNRLSHPYTRGTMGAAVRSPDRALKVWSYGDYRLVASAGTSTPICRC